MGIFTTTEEFIAKLERLNFNKVEDKVLINSDGFRLSYSTKLQTLIGSKEDCKFIGLPVQLLFRVTKGNQYVSSWGCEGLEDTTLLAKWYQLKYNEIERLQDDKDRKDQLLAQHIWDNV